jgi:hypothetical protein
MTTLYSLFAKSEYTNDASAKQSVLNGEFARRTATFLPLALPDVRKLAPSMRGPYQSTNTPPALMYAIGKLDFSVQNVVLKSDTNSPALQNESGTITQTFGGRR